MKPVCIKTFIPRHLHSQFFRGWDIRVAFSQESSFNTLWRANQPLTPTFLSISPHYRSHHKYEWERDCCVFFFHIEATYSKMGVRDVLGEVVPFTVMVTMEGCTIGLTILAKTAMRDEPFRICCLYQCSCLHSPPPLVLHISMQGQVLFSLLFLLLLLLHIIPRLPFMHLLSLHKIEQPLLPFLSSCDSSYLV